ncbi:hypothetical protein V8B97DRAFT_1943070, partial [Scleroderma yunnanense]
MSASLPDRVLSSLVNMLTVAGSIMVHWSLRQPLLIVVLVHQHSFISLLFIPSLIY